VSDAPPEALKRFIWDIQSMVELAESDREILLIGRDLMGRLLACDNWLPPAFAAADPARARQFQLYADAMERFTIVSTVLAPGQTSAIAAEPFWQILGVWRGALSRRRFAIDAEGALLADGREQNLATGALLAAPARDAAQLVNLDAERAAIAIQVFGGDIGRRPRQNWTPDGEARNSPTLYDNAEDAPPYDIWTIQTRIED